MVSRIHRSVGSRLNHLEEVIVLLIRYPCHSCGVSINHVNFFARHTHSPSIRAYYAQQQFVTYQVSNRQIRNSTRGKPGTSTKAKGKADSTRLSRGQQQMRPKLAASQQPKGWYTSKHFKTHTRFSHGTRHRVRHGSAGYERIPLCYLLPQYA